MDQITKLQNNLVDQWGEIQNTCDDWEQKRPWWYCAIISLILPHVAIRRLNRPYLRWYQILTLLVINSQLLMFTNVCFNVVLKATFNTHRSQEGFLLEFLKRIQSQDYFLISELIVFSATLFLAFLFTGAGSRAYEPISTAFKRNVTRLVLLQSYFIIRFGFMLIIMAYLERVIFEHNASWRQISIIFWTLFFTFITMRIIAIISWRNERREIGGYRDVSSGVSEEVFGMACAWPRMCQHCGYSLLGLDDGSTCPECGKRMYDSFDEQKQLSVWRYANLKHELHRCFIGWIKCGSLGNTLATRIATMRVGENVFRTWTLSYLLLLLAIYLTLLTHSIIAPTQNAPSSPANTFFFSPLYQSINLVTTATGFYLSISLLLFWIIGLYYSHQTKRNLLGFTIRAGRYLSPYIAIAAYLIVMSSFWFADKTTNINIETLNWLAAFTLALPFTALFTFLAIRITRGARYVGY
ncbi:hypothetical protein JD969_05835 [Planctomycetota bacterium]|nr:hypothetical protein JD969_05835 [Planctomycetota bacterium]